MGDPLSTLKWLSMRSRLAFQGRPLVADLYKPVSLSYRVQERAEGGVLIEGVVRWGDQELLLSDCDLVGEGPPHWIVSGVRLKLLAGEIEWRWIERAMNGWRLSAADWPAVERDLQRGGELAPPYEWAGPPGRFTPTLHLCDQRASFANLFFDYGEGVRRDPAGEAAAVADLISAGYERRQIGNSNYYSPVDRAAEALSLLLSCGWQCLDERGRPVVELQSVEAVVEQEGSRFVATGTVEAGGERLALGEVVEACRSGRTLLPTPSGKVALLSPEWSRSELAGLIEGERVVDKVVVRRAALGALGAGVALSSDLRSQIAMMGGGEVALPGAAFCAQLRPYQQEGLNWLAGLGRFGLGGILADEMGLGKTVQIISWLSRMEKGVALIVVPTSLLCNWQRELRRFLPGMEVTVHHGPDRGALPTRGVVLTSYATLRLDLPLFQEVRFELMALDEAQVVKNPDSQTARAIFQLEARLRVAITGTPIENSWQDLWSLMRFAQPDLLGERSDFLARSGDPSFCRTLQRSVAPFLLRRKKSQVAADLPEKIEQTVWIEWEPQEEQLYRELHAAVRARLLKRVSMEGERSPVEILEGLLRLRQLCCHPSLIESHLSDDAPRTSSKLEWLLSELEGVVLSGGKALVYSQFTSMLQKIEGRLGEMGLRSLRLDGETRDRQAVVDRFQEDPSQQILLISLKAGGVGLNLTAADAVFLYEPWWTEAAEQQAIDRAHRIGQERTVLVKRAVVVGTIEERMMELKAAKRATLDQLFSGEELSFSGSGWQELLLDLFENG